MLGDLIVYNEHIPLSRRICDEDIHFLEPDAPGPYSDIRSTLTVTYVLQRHLNAEFSISVVRQSRNKNIFVVICNTASYCRS